MIVKTNCHECIHSRSNAFVNLAHVHCHLYWAHYKKNKSEHPQGQQHAEENGWWDFPYDYDPIWMKQDCKGFQNKTNTPESKL